MSVTSQAAAPRIARVPPIGQRLRTERIVVGVDGSPGSGAAVRWATAVACRRHAALRMVSAWQETDQDRVPGALADLSLTAASWVQDALDELFHQLDRPQRVSCVTLRGVPGKVLVDQAEAAELLVLGGAGTGPGATGTYCIRYARCPVVFVPA